MNSLKEWLGNHSVWGLLLIATAAALVAADIFVPAMEQAITWHHFVFLAAVGLVLIFLGARQNRAQATGVSRTPIEATIMLVVGMAAVAGSFFLLYSKPEVLEKFPYLIPVVIGVVAFPSLLFTIIYMSKVAEGMGFGSPKHAFGLPPGTVRGVLALGFMILVLIFGAFTITIVSSGIDTVQTKELIVPKDVTPAKHWETERVNHPNFFLKEMNAGDGTKGGIIEIAKPGADDAVVQIAQQVLTMLATALTAIVGFYFGSRSANEPDLSQFTEKARQNWNSIEAIGADAAQLNSSFMVQEGLRNNLRDRLTDSGDDKDAQRAENLSAYETAFSNAMTQIGNLRGQAQMNKNDPIKIAECLPKIEQQWKKAGTVWQVLSAVATPDAGETDLAKLDEAPA